MGLIDAALTPVLFCPSTWGLFRTKHPPPSLLPHHYLRSTWCPIQTFPVPSMGRSITIHWAKATRSGTPQDSQAGRKNDVQLKAGQLGTSLTCHSAHLIGHEGTSPSHILLLCPVSHLELPIRRHSKLLDPPGPPQLGYLSLRVVNNVENPFVVCNLHEDILGMTSLNPINLTTAEQSK